jgi:SAM-dependent methyltransferase
MTTEKRQTGIRTNPVPNCCVCGSEGKLLYQGLRDRLYDAPGTWSMRRCPNPECGLLWLDPVPIAEDIGILYETYYTHEQVGGPPSRIKRLGQIPVLGYLRGRMGYKQGVGPAWYALTWPLAYLHWFGISAVRAQAMYLPAPANGAKLLEIGFGDGRLLAEMREKGWSVEGVDTDPVSVGNAREVGLHVALGDVREQGYPDDTFDAVIMRDVLEHVLDLPGFLAECTRILKPGGRLVAAIPNADSLGLRVFGRDWYPLDAPRHLYIYTHGALRQAAESCGLTVDSLTSNCHFAFWMWRMSVMIRSPRGLMMSPIPRKFGALAYQIWERALLQVSRFAGERIVLVARKEAR